MERRVVAFQERISAWIRRSPRSMPLADYVDRFADTKMPLIALEAGDERRRGRH